MLFSLTNPEVAIFMMGLFLFAVLLGFPIAFTLMAMGIGFGYYAYYDPALMDHIFDNRIFSLFVKNTYTVMDNNVLTAVPLFLFMGYLVERAGIVSKLFFCNKTCSSQIASFNGSSCSNNVYFIFYSHRNYWCRCNPNGSTCLACNG
jgi:TRAP-type mannitol/chloroaromatic compound transport system permease large subunit